MKRIFNAVNQKILWITSVFSAPFFFAIVARAADSSLANPLNKSISSIPDFISAALKAVVMIALPIITLFIVVSGFMFLFAQGNQGKLDRAKENFMWVIVGTLLILGAWVLATLLAGTVTQLLGNKP